MFHGKLANLVQLLLGENFTDWVVWGIYHDDLGLVGNGIIQSFPVNLPILARDNLVVKFLGILDFNILDLGSCHFNIGMYWSKWFKHNDFIPGVKKPKKMANIPSFAPW